MSRYYVGTGFQCLYELIRVLNIKVTSSKLADNGVYRLGALLSPIRKRTDKLSDT